MTDKASAYLALSTDTDMPGWAFPGATFGLKVSLTSIVTLSYGAMINYYKAVFDE